MRTTSATPESEHTAQDDLELEEASLLFKNNIWKCGNPNYYIPEPTLDIEAYSYVDSWRNLYNSVETKDKARRTAWEAEISNLLIFAGLFSAVVAAFIVQTFPQLTDSPVTSSNQSISAITGAQYPNIFNMPHPSICMVPHTSAVPQSSNSAIPHDQPSAISSPSVILPPSPFSQSSVPSTIPQPSVVSQSSAIHQPSMVSQPSVIPQPTLIQVLPSASTIRLNIFLFLSLITSLSTTLIGIICLQWLRGHAKPQFSMAPHITLAVLCMRQDALEKWYVPHIITSLPVLLQIAVLLFFAAIFELLLHNGLIQVIIPIGILMGSTILILILTTALPSFQILKLYLFGWENGKIVAPCPYLSPQSSLFYLSIWPIPWIIDLLRSPGTPAPAELILASSRRSQIRRLWKAKVDATDERDTVWMKTRDMCSQFFSDTINAGWSDLGQSLCKEILNSNFVDEKSQSFNFAIYHCALSYIFELLDQGDTFSRYRYFASCMGYPQTVSHYYIEELNREEASFITLYAIGNQLEDIGISFHPISMRLAESYLRLVGYIFMNHFQLDCNFEVTDQLPILFPPELLYAMDIYRNFKGQPFTWRWAKALDTYFQALAQNIEISNMEALSRTLPIHCFFRQFTYNFWRQFDNEIWQQHEQLRTVNQVIATFKFIKDELEKASPSEIFFWSTAYHVQFYRRRDVGYTNKGNIEEAIRPVISCLRLLRMKPQFQTEEPTSILLLLRADAERMRERDHEQSTAYEFESKVTANKRLPDLPFSKEWLDGILGNPFAYKGLQIVLDHLSRSRPSINNAQSPEHDFQESGLRPQVSITYTPGPSTEPVVSDTPYALGENVVSSSPTPHLGSAHELDSASITNAGTTSVIDNTSTQVQGPDDTGPVHAVVDVRRATHPHQATGLEGNSEE